MSRNMVVKRFGLFLVVIWGAATLNFFLPRIGPGDPVRERLFALSTQAYSFFENKMGYHIADPSILPDRKDSIMTTCDGVRLRILRM